MFTGLSAFPITPITASGVDEKGFNNIFPPYRRSGGFYGYSGVNR
jgi:dihydrodipicolinate synthase/N-acetylneuraminate lyase